MCCWWWERVFLEVLFTIMAATQYVFIWHHGPLQREVWVWVILGDRWLIQHIMERNFTEEIYLHIFRHWYMFQWPVNKSLGQVWNKWHWHSSAREVLCLSYCCNSTWVITHFRTTSCHKQRILLSLSNHTEICPFKSFNALVIWEYMIKSRWFSLFREKEEFDSSSLKKRIQVKRVSFKGKDLTDF